MAKRKKSRKHTTRRHRMGGTLNAKNPLVKFGSIAAGYFLGNKVNELVDKATGGKIDGKIVAGAEAGLGLLLIMKGKKTPMKTILGGVLLGAGVKKGLTEFGVINGFHDVPVIAGYHDVPVLGAPGYAVPSASINGYNVPQSPARTVMGGVAFDETGSGINASDR